MCENSSFPAVCNTSWEPGPSDERIRMLFDSTIAIYASGMVLAFECHFRLLISSGRSEAQLITKRTNQISYPSAIT